MPEYIRTLIVILFLSLIVFGMAKRPANSIMEPSDFARRRNLWYVITLTGFLSPNFWLFVAVSGMFLLAASKREHNLPALFFSVLFALPIAYAQIPGFGLINYLIDFNYLRLLELVVLLPAFLHLSRSPATPGLGRLATDKWLLGYALLSVLLFLRETTITDTLRQAVYVFIDVVLPYYVISRLLATTEKFREALLAFVIAVMILSLIGAFETARHWLLYAPWAHVLGLKNEMTGYLGRDFLLRACASVSQPIVLGYVIMVAIGFYLFLQKSITNTIYRRLGLALLVGGLLAPLSRGPWLGTLVVFVVFLATGPSALRRIMILTIAGALALPAIAVLPGGERVINLLPFIGKTDEGNIEYRDQLITNASIVIRRNFLLGSVDYMETPEMLAMRNGNHQIDVVNSYIGIALEKGMIGLGLFVGFFASVVFGIYRTLRSLPDGDEKLLGRVLLATLIGILFTIMTVSSITYIPVVYWSVAGLGVAYLQMIKKMKLEVRP